MTSNGCDWGNLKPFTVHHYPSHPPTIPSTKTEITFPHCGTEIISPNFH